MTDSCEASCAGVGGWVMYNDDDEEPPAAMTTTEPKLNVAIGVALTLDIDYYRRHDIRNSTSHLGARVEGRRSPRT